MIYYLINHLLFLPNEGLPNPFEEFKYDLLVSIAFEFLVFYIAKWSAKVVASRLRKERLKYIAIIPFFIVYYAIIWGCLFIKPWELGLALAIGIIVGIAIVLFIIMEKIIAKKPFDIDRD